ncbi:MAG: MGMT family protein, partial [Nitrospirae bacterium]
ARALPPLPWRLIGGTPFERAVWLALAAIPPGTTWSYGELAAHLGRPRAARAVGRALGRNPLPVLLPCHRVVAAAGPGGFRPGLAWKRYLLRLEGAELPGGPGPAAGGPSQYDTVPGR